ncbi:MAG TPA: hypothetical protein VF980_05850, partial [Thermoanaerobaculia bacterium]
MSRSVRFGILVLALLSTAQLRQRPPFGLRGVHAKIIEFTSVPHDWPQFNFDARHSGSNTLETEISPDTVTSLQLLFQTKLPAVSDSAP